MFSLEECLLSSALADVSTFPFKERAPIDERSEGLALLGFDSRSALTVSASMAIPAGLQGVTIIISGIAAGACLPRKLSSAPFANCGTLFLPSFAYGDNARSCANREYFGLIGACDMQHVREQIEKWFWQGPLPGRVALARSPHWNIKNFNRIKHYDEILY
jgi:hypothetical protein